MSQTKFTLLIIFSLLTTMGLRADEDAKKVKATLNQATVFFDGAELIHTATSAVEKGVNEVWITELSPSIDINSLKINTTKGIIIASHEYSLDFITRKEISTSEKILKDSVKYYKKRITDYEISTKTNEDLLELLRSNKTIGGSQTGLNVTDLMKMMDYYKAQSNELNKTQRDLEEKLEKENKSLERVENQLFQESAKNTKAVGVLKLNLTAPLATSTDFTVTYYTKSASWAPYYDINVPNTNEQIQINSKAKVAQTTGLDWNKVKLALSTTAPNISKEAPLFDAWFLDFNNFSGYQVRSASKGRPAAMLTQNSYSYDDHMDDELSKMRGDLMVEMNQMVDLQPEIDRLKRQLSNLNQSGGSSSEIRELRAQLDRLIQQQGNNGLPLHIINGQVATMEEFNNLSPDIISNVENLKGSAATSAYGSSGANGVVLVTTKSLTDYVKRDEGELSAIYNIELPYTIQGNGKIQNIDLQTYSLPADFKHYAVPKLDSEVFVLAEIGDWQKLGLLSGKANVTFDGTYVGETAINASSIASKLTLTLGIDKRVTVKREKLQDFSSQKFMGRDTRQDFTYKITVKNNQNRAIKMVLKDQYPLSKQKDIQVELLKESTPATHTNEEVGVLNWESKLNAGETKEFRVAYTVKYPKDKEINW